MTEAYVIVNGVASDEDDLNDNVPGTYEVEISENTPDELRQEVALEILHHHVAIAVLDDFEISVVDENGEPFADQSDDPKVLEKLDLLSMGSFLGRCAESDIPFGSVPKATS